MVNEVHLSIEMIENALEHEALTLSGARRKAKFTMLLLQHRQVEDGGWIKGVIVLTSESKDEVEDRAVEIARTQGDLRNPDRIRIRTNGFGAR
jgi:hypothetical protein